MPCKQNFCAPGNQSSLEGARHVHLYQEPKEHQCCSFGLHVSVDTAKPVHEFEDIDYQDASMFVMTSIPSVGITPVRS